MDAPSISSHHDRELKLKYPYTFYTWNRIRERFELWCDEGKGELPYKFMILEGPEGEYREPGSWVIDKLRFSDSESGHYQTGTVAGRKDFVQSLEDGSFRRKMDRDKHATRMEMVKDEARHLHNHGRNVSMDPSLQPKARHRKVM